jgi:ferredoxin
MPDEIEAIDPVKCIRCGACASIAPNVFGRGDHAYVVLRPPRSSVEQELARAALVNCPSLAIHTRNGGDPGRGSERAVAAHPCPPGTDLHDDAAPVFDRLFDEAERARWRLDDLPWSGLLHAAVTPELVGLVREIAAAEATTFSATQRFLGEFSDDVDFTNWISVWFYEETKHPQALSRWLGLVGAAVDERSIRRARVTAPFMKSRFGTLVTNIISEMVASARYMGLHARSPEPLLARIAGHLAGDEARHAASFFTFARKRLAGSRTPELDRRDALKVLHLWASDRDNVRHPVNLFHGSSTPAFEAVQSRVVRMIGSLVGIPLGTPDDVLRQLRDTTPGEQHGTA